MSKNKINGKKKLLLKKETLRDLKERDMDEAAGGTALTGLQCPTAGTYTFSINVLTAKCDTMVCGTFTCRCY